MGRSEAEGWGMGEAKRRDGALSSNRQLSTVNCQRLTVNEEGGPAPSTAPTNCQLSTVNCQLSTV
ncbi:MULTISPECIES: hypothetical protein [unclassified Microcoleus]|uniref:hypothetical protein n=1 Tax=unclassified Microcoleus TaxID=2642155 RepID=UPI0025F74C4C|nr:MULTISPECIES: hypothetical protein [unclassified Microcoleus]